ncbi:hypothetical protein ABK040_009749 [Willaertia magna]
MKRSENPSTTSSNAGEQQLKKVKQQSLLTTINNGTKIINLSKDEIRIILSFQQIGEILFLSLICKEMYQQIEEIIKQQHPILFSLKEEEKSYRKKESDNENQLPKPWSIVRALREMKKLSLQPKNVESIINFLTKEEEGKENTLDDLSIITNRLIIRDRWNSQVSVDELMDIVTLEQSKIKQLTVYDAIEFNKEDDGERLSFEEKSINYTDFKMVKQIEVSPVPIGFTLKQLKLSTSCSRYLLYELLSKCINLEYLYLSIESDYSPLVKKGKGKGFKVINKVENKEEENGDNEEEEESNVVIVPILKKLKELHLISCFDYDTGSQFVIDILKLTPNLENFNFIYHDPPSGDELLNFLIENCKHLKRFDIAGDEGATPCPHSFSDNGILNLLQNIPTITHLNLQHCNNISGQLFSEIGKYAHNLEHLLIDRSGYEAGFECEIYQDLHVGGGELTKLKSLTLTGEFDRYGNGNEENEESLIPENFFKTLYQYAPNLLHFNLKTSISFLNLHRIINLELRREEFFKEYLDCENLESLIFNNRYYKKNKHSSIYDLTENALQNCKWSKLKVLKMDWISTINSAKEWLVTLLSKCPNLEMIEIFGPFKEEKKLIDNEEGLKKEFNETIIELLKEKNNWPNLFFFKSFTFNEDIENKLSEIRPLLMTHKFRKSSLTATNKKKEEFYCEWINSDKLKKQELGNGKNEKESLFEEGDNDY